MRRARTAPARVLAVSTLATAVLALGLPLGSLSSCAVAFGLLAAAPAAAQHVGDMGSAPPPPAGDATITVEIVNADDPGDVAGLEVALYSLGGDGQPGYTNGKTDASGVVRFAGVASDPGIVYLVGAHYEDIPFGERIAFEAGAKEARAQIEVSVPTDDARGVRVEELRVRLDWLGERVLVREIVRLVNPGRRVIQLPRAGTAAKGAGERVLVRRPLPAEARDFEVGTASVGEGLSFEQGAVRYFGPLYPGDQRIEYQYTLPSPAPGARLSLPIELDREAARVVAVAGTSGLAIEGPGLVASSEVRSDSGASLAAWARGPLRAGERSLLEATLPETRRDPALVSVPRADVWLDLDDTRLAATVDVELVVAPGSPVTGTPEAPLLSVTLPKGATLTGVAPEAEGLGLVPRDHGGFDVIGPIGEGKTNLGYAYRIDARPEGLSLDLRFSRAVSRLNVLSADTGLALDSSRLHRLRPFRSGTRNYLHREAFNVLPDETVDLRLAPLHARGIPREGGLAFAFVAIAGAAAYLMSPLRRGAVPRATGAESPAAVRAAGLAESLAAEREAVYASIRDLDHDFETGKLEPADYESMRAALRGRAIELLRAEQASGSAAGEPPPAAAATMQAAPAPTAAYCPACGAAREPAWRFCAGCGATLPAVAGAAAAPAAPPAPESGA